MECHDYEIAIEKHQRGALRPDEEAPLLAHLDDCASCGAFRDFARRTETMMQRDLTSALDDIDWTEIHRGVGRWKRDLRTSLRNGALVSMITVPLSVFLLRAEGIGVAVFSMLMAVGATLAWGWVHQRRRLAELREVEDSQRELVRVYRKHLDRQIETTRQNGWVAPLLGIVALFWFHGPSPLEFAAAATLAALLGGLGLRARFVALPRQLRERALLR